MAFGAACYISIVFVYPKRRPTMRAAEVWYGSVKKALSVTRDIFRFVGLFSPHSANAGRWAATSISLRFDY